MFHFVRLRRLSASLLLGTTLLFLAPATSRADDIPTQPTPKPQSVQLLPADLASAASLGFWAILRLFLEL